MANERILIIDDERKVAQSIEQMLSFEGFLAEVATNLREAEALLHKSLYDAAIIDLRMEEEKISGIEVLARCREIDPAMATLMLTAYGTVDTAAEAFKLGARDFLVKPIRREDLAAAVHRALDGSRLMREARTLRERLRGAGTFDAIIGNSPRMREALDHTAAIANSDIPVVILGETGTGKELVAAAIHAASPRAEKPMVTALMSALPRDLRESQLFGHVKGAFTGAVSSHRGYFQEAHGGTLFLDEIGELPLEIQGVLLRAVEEEQRIRPVGADKDTSVDVRIICATNRDLLKDVEEGRFRRDLYHRIGGEVVELPPLRERREDIPLLAAHFVQRAAGQGRSVPEIEPDALARLCGYDWPGNVRELKAVIERAVLLSSGGAIRWRDCFGPSFSQKDAAHSGTRELSLKEATDRFTAEYLAALLAKYDGDTARAADHAGVHVTSIRRKIRELGLQKEAPGPGDTGG